MIEMEPGRELDAKVAEALGFTAKRIETDAEYRKWNGDDWFMGTPDVIAEIGEFMGRGGYSDYILPHFSTDIAAAFIAVNKMREQGFRFRLQDLHSNIRQASFFDKQEYGAMIGGITDAHAIALAIVAAKETTQ